ERRIDVREEARRARSIEACGRARQARRLWARSEGAAHVLGAVAAAARHRDLIVRAAEERVERAGAQLDGGGALVGTEELVEVRGRMRAQPPADLLGEARGVRGGLEGLACDDARCLVL